MGQSTPTQNIDGPVVLLGSAWHFFKTNWKILVPIALVPSVILMVGSLVGLLGGVFMFIGFIVSIVGAVFSIAMAPALITTLPKIEGGAVASVRIWPQYKEGFKFFFVVLGLGILQGLIALGSAIWILVPFIIVAVYLSVYIFARILDDKKGFSAFTESFSLIKGRWWKVLGRLLFFALVYLGCAIIIMILDLLFAAIFGSKSTITFVLTMVAQLALTAIVGPLALVYIYRMYNSLKVTRLQNVSTGTFKKWLITFLVIGIIVVVLIPITGAWSLIQIFKSTSYVTESGLPSGLNIPMNVNVNDLNNYSGGVVPSQ